MATPQPQGASLMIRTLRNLLTDTKGNTLAIFAAALVPLVAMIGSGLDLSFAYMAKAIIVFPGGFGTLDELFEVVTLVQTGKLTRPIKIVLYGTEYWHRVINFDALAEFGTISKEDIKLMTVTDSVDAAYKNITEYLAGGAMHEPGGAL